MRALKSLLIPIVIVLGYLLLVSYPYFLSKINTYSSLGLLSLVEERSERITKTGKAGEHLFAGEKIKGELKASENNLGIVLVRFSQLSPKVTDRVTFRIKEVNNKDWYYENTHNADQFQPNEYFTFGFPGIKDSKNKIYTFEVESLAGNSKNGVGLSTVKPQTALVYKPTKDELGNINIFNFIFNKFVYVVNNVDFWKNWPLLIGTLLVYFTVKEKPFASKKRIKFVRNYFILTKRGEKFLKRINRNFVLTRILGKLLDTNFKKRLAIAAVIFLLAFLYRFSRTDMLGTASFYAGLGGQGDYDQFIRAATCAVKTFCPAILGQNFLIESSILGVFYEIFGFVGGLNAYLYFMIILSSFVATLPYLILSRKGWATVGGVIGGIYIAFSNYLTDVSVNFPPDNGSLFIFSIFYIVYLLTIQKGTIRWLLLFGLVGIIDGLNKLFFLLNDLVALALFIPVFIYEKSNRIKKFPFIKLSPRIILYSVVPLFVFFLIYSVWEAIVQIKFGTPYYLRALILGGSTYESSTIAGASSLSSGLSDRNILELIFYYAGSSVVVLKRIIFAADLNFIFLSPVLLGLLFVTFKIREFFIAKLISVIIFVIFTFITLELFRNNFLGVHEIGQYVYAWPNYDYINIFLFAGIIFLFAINFRYKALKYALPIIPYVIMLIILAKNNPELRLLVHVIVWSIILFSFLTDWILTFLKTRPSFKKFSISPFILMLFFIFYFLPKAQDMTVRIYNGVKTHNQEIKYLKWVNQELPDNTIILAGGKSDLARIAQEIRRPIIYNSSWVTALLIKPAQIPKVKASDFTILADLKITEIPGLSPSDFNVISELKNKENFKKNRYLILENDIYLWRWRLAGVGDNVFNNESNLLLHGDNYSLQTYKFNSSLKKGIYELKFNEKKD